MPAEAGRPLIIGIATVDAVARTIERFPAPGGLQVFDELTTATGGCAVNTTLALARLGIGADIITRVGCDPNGDFVLDELARHGVATDRVVRDPERGTSFSFVAVHPGGERSFLHTPGANARIAATDVPDEALAGRPIVFVAGAMVMDRLDGEPAAALLARARAAGARTMLDTVFVEGLSTREWRARIGPALPHLDDFVPSLPEALAISGEAEPLDAAEFFRREGVRRVAIKLGEHGALCLDEAGGVNHVPAFRVGRVVDATGAGDCWCAGLIAAFLAGEGLPTAAALGNAVAAMAITGPGATGAVPSLQEARAFVARPPTARDPGAPPCPTPPLPRD
ncbi:MAG: carbohydrate kinase family protein [Phycisphaerales bacterium]|nr:carbohydrate kinase family protein [Phycisphaerales bacterium]